MPERCLALFVALGMLTASVSTDAADQELYFSKSSDFAPVGTAPLVFGNNDSIDFELVLRTRSVEDRTRFPGLVINDYKVDVPNYYADHRVPNVRFEVLEVIGGNATRPASYRVSTQGDGGVNVQYLDADVWFELGRFHATYWLIDRLWYVGALLFAHHAAGTYRIRAFYRDFVTPPILVVVK